MTTILTPTSAGIAVQSSLGDASTGRFCRPPQVPDRCYVCFDDTGSDFVHRPATGYVEETHPVGGTWRYGTCPDCWSRRTQRPYLQWTPAGTACVYRAVKLNGQWCVYGFNEEAAIHWTGYAAQGYLIASYAGPLNNTSVYLTEKAVAEATEFFLVQNARGDWLAEDKYGQAIPVCFHCGEGRHCGDCA